MQKLVYQSAWEKQISNQDRELVEDTFRNVSLTDKPVQFTPLRMDFNYKKDLLMMVIIHNTSEHPLTFHDKKLLLKNKGLTLAEHNFTLPNLTVLAKTSMPWTFIFPTGSYVKDADFNNEELTLETEKNT